MTAHLLPFPNRNEPTDEDVIVLLRASIKLYYKRVRDTARDAAIITSVGR